MSNSYSNSLACRFLRRCKITFATPVLLTICVLSTSALLATLIAWAVLSDGFRFGWNTANPAAAEAPVCQTEACVVIAAEILKSLNPGVDPCHDFYDFVCGNYDQDKELPNDQSRINMYTEMELRLTKHLKALLDSEDKPDELLSQQRARLYYRSCNNMEILKKLSVEPMRKLLDRHGGWPVVDGANWKEPVGVAWEKLNAELSRNIGVFSLIVAVALIDMKNSSRRMLHFDHAQLCLYSREYYLIPSPVLDEYFKYMVKMAVALGATEEDATREMEDVLNFEILLANITDSDEDRRDHNQLYNPMTVGELKESFPDVDLALWLRILTKDILNLTDSEVVNVVGARYIRQLSAIVRATPIRTVMNYQLWYAVMSYQQFLSPEMREPANAVRKALSGVTEDLTRWKECVETTKNVYPLPVSSLYVQHYFSSTEKHYVERLASDVRRAMHDNINDLKWMDYLTKGRALSKLAEMMQKIGYPEYIFNKSFVDGSIYHVPIAEDTYFDNTLAMYKARGERNFLELRKPIEQNEWETQAAVINAYYSPDRNEILFPAGILHFPVFSSEMPHYISYARLGMIIGHEISHGYDDEGGQYDEHGNLAVWWTNETLLEFTARTQCFIDQYGNITEPYTERQLNGRLTLGENIADNAGIKLTHKAYQLRVREANVSAQAILPGLGNFTVDQLFFVAYASSWCEMSYQESLLMLIVSDTHSLPKYRVNLPLQNYYAFSDAFQCPLGSEMNPETKCIIW